MIKIRNVPVFNVDPVSSGRFLVSLGSDVKLLWIKWVLVINGPKASESSNSRIRSEAGGKSPRSMIEINLECLHWRISRFTGDIQKLSSDSKQLGLAVTRICSHFGSSESLAAL